MSSEQFLSYNHSSKTHEAAYKVLFKKKAFQTSFKARYSKLTSGRNASHQHTLWHSMLPSILHLYKETSHKTKDITFFKKNP